MQARDPIQTVDEAKLGALLSAISRAEFSVRKFLVHGDRDLALMQQANSDIQAVQAAATAVKVELEPAPEPEPEE